MKITSLDNSKIKYYKSLQKKKNRDLNNEFIVEGEHLVLEAYKHGFLKEILLCEEELMPLDVPKIVVTYDVLKKISSAETPQKIMGVCRKMDDTTIGSRILVLDEVQDPGNLGTIIRSAVAFDIDTIILGDGCVDLYNPKVIRSTQGMLFHIPIFSFPIDKLIPILKGLEVPIFATRVEYGVEVETLNEEEKARFALIVGNEGNGVNPLYLEKSDKNIYIPMNGQVESLNVAVATSIILYEMRRKG